jgi:hypothetical protein
MRVPISHATINDPSAIGSILYSFAIDGPVTEAVTVNIFTRGSVQDSNDQAEALVNIDGLNLATTTLGFACSINCSIGTSSTFSTTTTLELTTYSHYDIFMRLALPVIVAGGTASG